MKTGLVELSDGRKFYFDSDGKMKTGRIVVNDDNHDNEVFYLRLQAVSEREATDSRV